MTMPDSHQVTVEQVINSGDGRYQHPYEFTAEDVPPVSPEGFDFFSGGHAEKVDAELIEDIPDRGSRLKSGKSERQEVPDKTPTSGIPKVDDWLDFFSRTVIRMATDFYIEAAFRDIDEDMLSDREVEKIRMSKEERDRIARPFAELANKMKFTRKHGRTIIASADSIDSLIQIGMWFTRVNRIAEKYRKMTGYHRPVRRPPVVVQPTTIRREETDDVSSGQNTSSGNGTGKWRPNIAGQVFNPDSA